MAILDIRQVRQVLSEETRSQNSEIPTVGAESKKASLAKLLSETNLSALEVLENLSSLMRSGDSDSVRLRAAETACKINGLLNSDESGRDFNVTIVINDSQFAAGGVNPILLPRGIS